MHLGLDIPATLVDVELHAHVPVVLQRKEEVIGILDGHRAVLLNVPGVHRPGTFPPDMQHRVIHIVGQHQRQSLEPLHDLMNVLEHALYGLVLVNDSVETETPHRASSERGEQQSAERVTQGVAKAALERLEAEFSGIGIVIALRHLDEVRTNQAGQVNGHGHFE